MSNLCKHFSGGVKSEPTNVIQSKAKNLYASTKIAGLACIIAATALTACTDETDSLAFTNSLKLSFGVNQPGTRAIFNEATLPDASPVGVKLDWYNYTGLTYTGTTASGKQTWAPNQDVVLTETSGTLYAYWPYSESIDMTAIPVDMTTADQTDWLYATPVEGINEDNASANVVMNHAAANINITINKGAYKGTGTIENITIQSDAFATNGTFNAAQAEPGFTAYEGEGEPLSRTVEITTGTATDIMVVPNGTSAVISFTATIDGIQFTATSAAVTLESGNSYQYTLNLSDINTYMSVEGFSVTPWNYLVKDNLTMDLYDPLAKYADWVKVTYNVEDNSVATQIFCNYNTFDFSTVVGMEVLENDGSRAVAEPVVVTPAKTYQFSTTGTHTVYVKFTDMTIIPEWAFYRCEALKEVNIPNSVTEIGEDAFKNCMGLTGTLTIPNSVQTIGGQAFENCKGLTEVTIPESVTSIGMLAFEECTGLTSITIPNSVTSIGDWAFNRCTGLKSIKVDGNNTVYDSRNNCNAIMETATNTLVQGCKNTVIPNDCQTIGEQAFEECIGLTEVNIPNLVTTIENLAFEGCTGITEVRFGEGVQTIGNKAFYECTGLTELVIPNSVQSIGDYAFDGCTGLAGIISLATTAPTIQSNTFQNVKSGGVLYVPTEATGYDAWMQNTSTYLGSYNWTMQYIPIEGTIDLTTAANGVYAVAQNGLGVAVADADESCIAVALIVNDATTPQRIMIEKEGEGNTDIIKMAYDADGASNTDYEKFYWGDASKSVVESRAPTSDVDIFITEDYRQWSNEALIDFDGKDNTACIIDVADTDSYTEFANMGTYCTKFNEMNGGYTDWYIPASGQCALIYLNHTEINTVLTKIGGTIIDVSKYYWTSSEYGQTKAYSITSGILSYYFNKNIGQRVRLVRDIVPSN